MAGALESGRVAFGGRAWETAWAELSAADLAALLEPDDLERLAVVAYLTGRDDESAGVWARAHQERLRLGDPAGAARCAFWLGLLLVLRGEMAQGGGWLARAQRLVDDGELDCVERGFLLVPATLERLNAGDAAGALVASSQAATIGDRFGDHDLVAFGQLGRGQALIALGKTADGVAQLDQAMVGVTAGEVSPVAVGIVYCAVLVTCQEVFELRRAQ